MLTEMQEAINSLRRLRAKVLDTLEGVSPEGLNWTPTNDATNSLLVMATHSVGSEHGWMFEILGRGTKTRDRPAEFAARDTDLSALRARYEAVARETEELLATRTEQDLLTTRPGTNYGEVNERWIILHVIEHYSEHLGQMYLTKQLWQAKGA